MLQAVPEGRGKLSSDEAKHREKSLRQVAKALAPLLEIVAEALGVTMLVTDMSGHRLIELRNPAPWLIDRSDDPVTVAQCVREWHALAADPDLAVEFRPGHLGFECARAFIRSGRVLTGMVLAIGVAPEGSSILGLHELDARSRQRVLAELPKVAASLSRTINQTAQPVDRIEMVGEARSMP